jgi:Zn-dependent peptidase ImmA (M78 family)
MVSKEFNRIQNTERKILEKYLSDYPVRLGQIAQELGVIIKVASLNTGVSGQIKLEGGQYVIRVNRHEARERQRFTIAHELAHFFLHKQIIDSSPDGIRDNVLYRSGEPEHIEFEANRLAADIVMPVKLVQDALQKDYDSIVVEATIEGLAAKFQVSKAAMEIRLSTIALSA